MTDALRQWLSNADRVAVAVSGGVDSMTLAVVAHQSTDAEMYHAVSPAVPTAATARVEQYARQHDWHLHIIDAGEFDDETYLANPSNRCYFCKHELFVHMDAIAVEGDFNVVAYGENSSDIGDHRPGANAAKKFKVCAPMKDAGMTKADIRACSKLLGLPTANKPQMPCLSSRIPYGQEVTLEKLAMIEKAEGILRDAEFREVRVRHHELSDGAMARLELGSEEMDRFLTEDWMASVRSSFLDVGFTEVELDTRGYRRGSLNESVNEQNLVKG